MRPPPGPVLFLLAAASFVGGCAGGGCVGASRTPPDPAGAVYAPLPHHVPPSPDAAAFRFAMVHDVIHERYPRHGPAFYEERERRARERLAVLHPDSELAFALTNDIAVGLARRGRTDEAIGLVRDKLRRQQALDLKGKDLYTSYANLGEFLVQGHRWPMMAGDAAARERVREGRDFLRKSVDVNPRAHFDQGEWQIIAVDMFLEASERPELIRQVDLIGNRLERTIEVLRDQHIGAAHLRGTQGVFARPYYEQFTADLHYNRQAEQYTRDLTDPARRSAVRGYIYEVGGEAAPSDSKGTERGKRAPFDEPALWLVGEWRQGSGPNPHYALCLGEIMLRVGQRYLAWTCYERARRMADGFWPTAELAQFLRDHCRRRQAAIERSLPPSEVADLRPRFEAELGFGEAYQRDYQAYTEEKVTAGGNINDPHFFDAFHASRPPIASAVGPEEWYAGSADGGQIAARFRAFWEWGLFTGGAAVLLLAIAFRLLCRPRYSPGPEFTLRR